MVPRGEIDMLPRRTVSRRRARAERVSDDARELDEQLVGRARRELDLPLADMLERSTGDRRSSVPVLSRWLLRGREKHARRSRTERIVAPSST